MQWLRTSGLLVVAFIIMAFASAEARAEHVDWSQYIDHSAPAKVAPAPQHDQASEAPAKKSRIAKKKVASKRKVKARAKKGRR